MAKKKTEKMTKTITINGMSCVVEGYTEEELVADAAAARAYAEKYHNNPEEMNAHWKNFRSTLDLAKDLDRVFEAPIFTAPELIKK